MIMYESLIDFLNIPCVIKPFSKMSTSGDKEYLADLNILCYPEGKVTVVTNREGTEVVSNTKLYINGSQPIGYDDIIVYKGHNHPIKAIGEYFENGAKSIQVVYV